MEYPKYEFIENSEATIFEFDSVGRYGIIQKVVRFGITNNPQVYNLAFGNKINLKGKDFTIDDTVISDNGDRDKVIATIAEAVFVFTEINDDKYVYFSGNSVSRNRLYRMVISNNLKELSEKFLIFGIIEKGSEGKSQAMDFSSAIEFKGFLIKRR